MIVVKEFEAPMRSPTFVLNLPPSARVLSVHPPFNLSLPAVLLVALDDRLPSQPRKFHWRPSGVDASRIGSYVGSAMIGLRFLHLFEEASVVPA